MRLSVKFEEPYQCKDAQVKLPGLRTFFGRLNFSHKHTGLDTEH